MAISAEVDEFLEVATASLPRISQMIAALRVEDRAGAFEVAERRFTQAARDFDCEETEAKRWVAALMRKLGVLVDEAAAAIGQGAQEGDSSIS